MLSIEIIFPGVRGNISPSMEGVTERGVVTSEMLNEHRSTLVVTPLSERQLKSTMYILEEGYRD